MSHMKRHHHICVAFCRWCQVEAEEENQRRVKFRWSFVSSNRKMLHPLVNQHRCGEAISSEGKSSTHGGDIVMYPDRLGTALVTFCCFVAGGAASPLAEIRHFKQSCFFPRVTLIIRHIHKNSVSFSP